MRIFLLLISFLLSQSLHCQNNPLIHKDDTDICEWGNLCTVNRGFVNVSDTSLGYADHGTDLNGTGIADGNFVSLGDGGTAIVGFDNNIQNGEGTDFAIFENGIYYPANQDSLIFAELAYVEVSSDGVNFVRFPSASNTQTNSQVGSFETINAYNITNLAGATPAMYGCGFDLEDISDSANVDINNISHIKITDVVGSIDPQYASFDASGNIINAPFPTAYSSCGFDLDAVAVINSTSESAISNKKISKIDFYPNPATEFLYLVNIEKGSNYKILTNTGVLCKSGILTSNKISINDLAKGTYILEIISGKHIKKAVFIK